MKARGDDTSMRAIILAAGRGSRMGTATSDKPKCLLEIKGKSLIQYQIEALEAAGVNKIALVTGYLAERLEPLSLTKFHNDKWYETNMVCSLTKAETWLSTYPCIVSYSDIFYESGIIKSLSKAHCDVAIAYDPDWKNLWNKRFDNPLEDAETFKISTKSLLLEIGQKTLDIDSIHGQYMGLLKFNPDGWNDIAETIHDLVQRKSKNIHLTEVLQEALKNGTRVQAVPNFDKWGEVDSQSDLELYNLAP